MIPPAALAFENVSKSYGGNPVLDHITLAIARGSFVALVGQSGSGKTTLLKTVNRLVQVESGRVLVNGEDVAEHPLSALRRRIGYVFQQTGLFPHLTVAQNIAMPLTIANRPKDDRVGELLDMVELPRAFATRMPAELSGGQAQRVGVARALAAEPSLMLMDEPFGALDPTTRASLGDAYRRLHERLGLTTILVTHDMADALTLADRIVILADGHIRADGTPGDLLSYARDPAIRELVEIPLRAAERIAALRSGLA